METDWLFGSTSDIPWHEVWAIEKPLRAIYLHCGSAAERSGSPWVEYQLIRPAKIANLSVNIIGSSL